MPSIVIAMGQVVQPHQSVTTNTAVCTVYTAVWNDPLKRVLWIGTTCTR